LKDTIFFLLLIRRLTKSTSY